MNIAGSWASVDESLGLEYRVEALSDAHDWTALPVPWSSTITYTIKPVRMPGASRRTLVMVGRSGFILGFYTLSAYSVLGELPPTVAKKLHRYPFLPATLLGLLAIASAV